MRRYRIPFLTRRPMLVVGLLLLALGVTGCALPVSPPGARESASDARWHVWRVRFARADDGSVRSYLDNLVADRVLFDVVAEQQSQILLWRFHRRWPDDLTGHQLSLMVYAPETTALAMSNMIARNPLVPELIQQGYLVEWRIDPPSRDIAASPAGLSDRHWGESVQREWPHFIMGASRFWVGLTRDAATARQDMALHARYIAVEEDVDDFWYGRARHALLHHLNALFAYRPIEYYDGTPIRF